MTHFSNTLTRIPAVAASSQQAKQKVKSSNQALKVSPIKNLADATAAFQLLYKEYLVRGYCSENSTSMHYSFFCLLPTSRTFIVKSDNKVIATISLIIDSPCGLPMECAFRNEVNSYRKHERKVAEVGLLALDQEFVNRMHSSNNPLKTTLLSLLWGAMKEFAIASGVTDYLNVCHPKHEKLYSNFGFNSVGPVKTYTGAEGNLGMPMWADMSSCADTAFDASPVNESPSNFLDSEALLWNSKLVRYLIFDRTEIVQKMTNSQLSYFKYLYPELSPG